MRLCAVLLVACALTGCGTTGDVRESAPTLTVTATETATVAVPQPRFLDDDTAAPVDNSACDALPDLERQASAAMFQAMELQREATGINDLSRNDQFALKTRASDAMFAAMSLQTSVAKLRMSC
jgi:hypothetical protein